MQANERFRRSKIKCIHQGEPPCQNCLRNGRTTEGDCILSVPDIVRTKRRRTSEHAHVPIGGDEQSRNESIDADCESCALNGVSITNHVSRSSDIWAATSRTDILQAASTFCRKFPELSFLHLGTFDFDSGDGTILLLKAALMALSCTSDQQNEYVAYVKTGISGMLLEPPMLETVQTLLVLAMLEWGHGRGYSAWMTTGTAIRMIQSFETMKGPTKLSELNQEIYNRTFWSCFIMDRLVFCGKSQPFTLPLEQMCIHLPLGDQDFAFGQPSIPRIFVNDDRESIHNGIDYSYSILVRGFDIWARILKWVINGGRRQAGMTKPVNCPWAPGSPWRNLFDDLNRWRQMQQPRMRYPDVRAAGHVSLRQGEQFTFINLIYYVSILFLGREYIPFLPTPDSVPKGPVDPPLLEAMAPEGWWAERAYQLFNAAGQITSLIEELEALGSPLVTPFTGFCVFSAATMNAYVSSFPRMNHGNSQGFAEELLEINIQWLSSFKKVWPMGNGWFKTIVHTRSLYTKASRDRQRFQGKTRADFEALEASIHDSSGVSPLQEDDAPAAGSEGHNPNQTTGHEAEAALGLQQLSHPPTIPQPLMSPLDEMVPDELSIFNNQWNHVWPLWGEQQSGLTAAGCFQFDYDFASGYQHL
ncbi:uncharacterized protein PAC_06741 [Phialocephala subalpina]|uniref:Xylanolytic transcriptional activator regulatory domain-containing protein n=1 Tax=Phialocephala subalpina TaxID=576137 RepID=A0A1L7WVR1_9HELO|nr:uncharacterized protein PAC_06741 [Phialocephala subalpina]